IKDFIKRSTPTRPNPKVSREKERQRLENLRKKQEAEEQRKKKVEEEKRRRQAEMKQKREERLRKALQARERVEQKEEEKKKRMEQKILQNEEKVCPSQVREEKMSEERNKRKVSKKHWDVGTRKQKVLREVRAAQLPPAFFLFLLQEENEQQEPLQKRREDEVKGKGKKVLELKNLLEQQQVEQVKERYELVPILEDPKLQGKEKPPQAQLEPAVLTDKTTKVGSECSGNHLPAAHRARSLRLGWDVFQVGYPAPWKCFPCSSQLSPWFQKSLSTSCLEPSNGVQGSGSPLADEDEYELYLKSDDSTDDESDPHNAVPAWADGAQLQEAILHQYYHPPDVDALFGAIPSPKLEHIFYKSKPRYFKRTSSAVWHSPP
ncbi:INCE protein, partial [Sapayoa aenigma]|nr:INCE protein [Sapayoa aenigma]